MLWTSSPFENFFSNFRAGLVMIALEIWLLYSILNFYSISTDNKIDTSLSSPLILIPFILIIILNYISFDHHDNVWKKYNVEFDNLSKRKNLIGGIIVWSIILFITASFFFSTFHLHKINYGTY